MEEEKNSIDIIWLTTQVWRARLKVLRWMAYGIIAGIIVVVSTPKEYQSMVKIAPEGSTKTSSAGALASMMGMSAANITSEGVNEKLYPEIITSTPFAMEFAEMIVEYKEQKMPLSEYILEKQRKPWWSYVFGAPFQLYGWVASLGSPTPDSLTIYNSAALKYAYATKFASMLKMEENTKQGFITVTATYQNPNIAKQVLDSLVVHLQRYMTNYRTAKTRQNIESNTVMLEIARNNFYTADKEYAEAMDKNANLVSNLATLKLNRLRDERDLMYQVYAQLATQMENDKIKLQHEISIATILEPVSQPVRPSKPNTIMILMAFAFLGGAVVVSKIVIKALIA